MQPTRFEGAPARPHPAAPPRAVSPGPDWGEGPAPLRLILPRGAGRNSPVPHYGVSHEGDRGVLVRVWTFAEWAAMSEHAARRYSATVGVLAGIGMVWAIRLDSPEAVDRSVELAGGEILKPGGYPEGLR